MVEQWVSERVERKGAVTAVQKVGGLGYGWVVSMAAEWAELLVDRLVGA